MKLYVPADTGESVKAAVQCGADAVVVRLNAPKTRNHVTMHQLPALAEYCRDRKVDLILRQHQIITDNTLTDELKLTAVAAKSGVNAVLTSDLGFLRAARQMLPDFPFYADLPLNAHSTHSLNTIHRVGFDAAIISEELFLSEYNALALNSTLPFFVVSSHYSGTDINELASVRKLSLLLDIPHPDSPEFVAATTELYSTALSNGAPVPLKTLNSLTLDTLPIAAIQAGLISTNRREVLPAPRPRYKGGEFIPPDRKPWEPHALPRVNLRISRFNQLSPQLIKLRPNVLYIPIDELLLAPEKLAYLWDDDRLEVCASLPHSIRDSRKSDELAKLHELLKLHVSSISISNLGHQELVRDLPLYVRADSRIPIANSQAVQLLAERNFSSCSLLPSLDLHQISSLFKFIDCEIDSNSTPRSEGTGLWCVHADLSSLSPRETLGALARLLST
jgi:hypothetical protein